VAIGRFKMGALLDSLGRSRDAVPEFERALALHEVLAAADPNNDALAAEIATDHNGLATALAKLGDRTGSLTHHVQAVETSRQLSEANPADVELRVALGLALSGRGEAHAMFARAGGSPTRRADLLAAERDYQAAVDVLSALQREGAIDGTDLTSLEDARRQLTAVRQELGGPARVRR
jgi:tetratricopeptide (TPR) repeat protein